MRATGPQILPSRNRVKPASGNGAFKTSTVPTRLTLLTELDTFSAVGVRRVGWTGQCQCSIHSPSVCISNPPGKGLRSTGYNHAWQVMTKHQVIATCGVRYAYPEYALTESKLVTSILPTFSFSSTLDNQDCIYRSPFALERMC